MTDLDTQLRAKEPEHAEIDRLMREFQARGGWIERLPTGLMKESELTPRQRVNPDRTINPDERMARMKALDADRIARKAEAMSRPSPKGSERVLKAPVATKGKGKGPQGGQPGTKTGELLETLKAGPMSAQEIAAARGWTIPVTRARLDSLIAQKLVEKAGDIRRPGQPPRLGFRLATRSAV